MKTIFNRNFWVLTMMGISSGLPLALTGGTLQAWLKSSGVDLTTIGLFALVGIPYTWKFLWSPLVDRFSLHQIGRRRSWMVGSQIALVVSILLFSQLDPKSHLFMVSLLAMATAFFSATQDIVLDAWRREQLSPQEFGWGNGLHVTGYLFSMRVISGALALILSDFISWSQVYQIMALIQSLGLVATFFCQEELLEFQAPKTLQEAFLGPMKEFFFRKQAFLILFFILLYKVGDNMAAHMSMPFYLDIGFSRTEVGSITKLVGWLGIAGGSLLGGWFLKKIPIIQGLFWFGLLQMISTFGFALLAVSSKSIELLTSVILFENFSAGLGTAAFVTFIGLMTNKQFTATQYALLSSLMGVPRILFAAPTGFMAESLGWFWFFLFCTLVALPGIIMLLKLRKIIV
jgi:MFS transporter, PAT family, beta-lactamase induction signal transducer AmpG